MKRWIFAIFSMILLVPLAHATVNDGHVVTTVGYVTHEMGTLQDKIPSQTGTKAMTFGDDAGEIGAREVKSNLGSSTSDDSLPTVSAVNTGLGTKQNTIAAGNANKVLTYTGVAGNVGEKGVYQDSGTYANQMDNLVTAGTFNAALRNGLENEFVCAETDPANGQCWAYSINNNGGPWNYFNMDDIPERSVNDAGTIARNSDGSITITGFAVATSKTLRDLAPGLEIGKTYKYSINTTSSNKQMLLYSSSNGQIFWANGATKTITADMLSRKVYFYTSTAGTSATISSIKITAVESGTPVGASGTILPAGYTPLEYIESTGTQYIDTGVAPTANFDIHLDGMVTQAYTVRPIFVTPNQNVYLGVFSATVLNSCINDNCGNGGIGYGGAGHRFHIALSPYRLLNSSGAEFRLKRPYTPSGNLRLLHSSYGALMRIYGIKLYDVTTLTFHGIPARRDSDGAVGLYDAVNSRFLANSGTGNFTAGPDANNNLYLPQNQ